MASTIAPTYLLPSFYTELAATSSSTSSNSPDPLTRHEAYLQHIRTGCRTTPTFYRTVRAFRNDDDIRIGMANLLRAFGLYAEASGQHWSCLVFTNGNPSLYRTTELYLPVLAEKTTPRDLEDTCVTVLTPSERRSFDVFRRYQLAELISYLLYLDSKPPARCSTTTQGGELLTQLRSGKPTDVLLSHAVAEVAKTRVLNATMALSKALCLKPTFSDDTGTLSFSTNDGTDGLRIHPFATFFGSDDPQFQFSFVPTTAIIIRNLGPLARNLSIRKIRHRDKTFKNYKAKVGEQPDHDLYKNDVVLNLALPGALAALAELLTIYDKEQNAAKVPKFAGGRFVLKVQVQKNRGVASGRVEKSAVGMKPSDLRRRLMDAARAEKKRKMASGVADWRKMGMRDHVRGET